MRTRSTSNKATQRESSCSDAEGSTQDHASSESIQGLLERALRGVKQMEHEVDTLQKKLEKAGQQPRRARRPVSRNAQELAVRNKHLEERHEKDLVRIRRLKAREIKVEAAELMNESHATVHGDAEYVMRKLLRRFSDLMEATTVETNAKIECAICFESLALTRFLSSPCEHLTCETCLSTLLQNIAMEGTVTCPSCRKPCASDSFQRLQYTESERWDELLKLATEWAKLDPPDLDVEVLDEKATENIEDTSFSELESASMTDCAPSNDGEELTRTQPSGNTVTPPPVQRPLYCESTPEEKRERMARLAKERKQKNMRYK